MEEDSKMCELCQTYVLNKCYDIHKRACQRKHQGSRKTVHLIKQEPKDLIPCCECGQMVSFSVYAVHIEECVGRQLSKCPQCKILYPIFLMQEHLNVCNTFVEEKKPPGVNENLSEGSFEDEHDEELEEMIMQLAAAHNEDEPLTPMEIDMIPRTNTKNLEQCSICYCSVDVHTQILRLPCPHAFHLRCITAWLQKNPHCPMCRRFVLK